MGILEPSQSNMPVYQYQKNNKCDAKKQGDFKNKKIFCRKRSLRLSAEFLYCGETNAEEK
jgi:hypothetical protein